MAENQLYISRMLTDLSDQLVAVQSKIDDQIDALHQVVVATGAGLNTILISTANGPEMIDFGVNITASKQNTATSKTFVAKCDGSFLLHVQGNVSRKEMWSVFLNIVVAGVSSSVGEITSDGSYSLSKVVAVKQGDTFYLTIKGDYINCVASITNASATYRIVNPIVDGPFIAQS